MYIRLKLGRIETNSRTDRSTIPFFCCSVNCSQNQIDTAHEFFDDFLFMHLSFLVKKYQQFQGAYV